MHGRARMIVATFLTKHLGHDWREGARHFARWLVDADVANNTANWQWVAGTGCDTRPGRILNPLRQAERFDRDGGLRSPLTSPSWPGSTGGSSRRRGSLPRRSGAGSRIRSGSSTTRLPPRPSDSDTLNVDTENS